MIVLHKCIDNDVVFPATLSSPSLPIQNSMALIKIYVDGLSGLRLHAAVFKHFESRNVKSMK